MISKFKVGLVAIFAAVTAQSLSAQQIDPIDVYQDPNGIDLVSNNVSTSQIPELSIPAAPELTFRDIEDYIPLLEVVTGDATVAFDPNVYTVSAGRVASDMFAQCANETCYASNGTGGMLFNAEGGDDSPNGGTQPCEFCPPPINLPQPGDVLGLGGATYRAGDSGMMMTFLLETEIASGNLPQPVRKFLAQEIIRPGGADLQIEYESLNVGGILRHRPSVVTSTSGYQLRFTYFANNNDPNWGILQKAEIVEATNPTVILASHTYDGNTVTDISGRVFGCVCQPDIYPTRPEQRGSRMQLPGETGNSFETFRQQGTDVRTVTADGVTFTYTSTPDNSWLQPVGSPWPIGAIHDITVTGPEGFYQFIDVTNIQATTGQYDPPRRRIDSVTDSLNNVTTYQYNGAQRLIGVTYPEGNSVSLTHDIRGNLTSRTDSDKPSSALPDITQTASHPSTSCGIIGFNCYQPTWMEDGEGSRTDFTWNAWGLMETSLSPADENNRRTKTINTWSGNAPINGETCPAFIQLGLPGPARCTPRLLKEEICETDANGNELTCGTANSYVREFTYPGTSSLPASETMTDGVGTGPLTTTYIYDNAGRLLVTDGPLPGSDDATYARYDILGRMTWEIGPKGENGNRPATNTEYRDADDQVERVQTGYVAGTTATSPSTPTFLAVTTDVETDYNTRRLATRTTVSSGSGAAQSVTQASYDGLNRGTCTAVRLNLSSLPADACIAGTPNADGEDRITRQHYDSEGRVERIEQGVGTSLVRDYATYSFTPNGQMASMTDARGYKASMMYDGFDRQTHWYFPDPDVPGAINVGDYELYGYDNNGNRTSLRKRDGSVITYQYDDLNRMIRKTIPDNRPELHADHTRDVFYEYDIRDLQVHARFGSDSGVGTSSVYDRYGRMTSVTDTTSGTNRTLQSQYLPDGSRWEMTFPDAQAFRFYYQPGGQFNHMTSPQGEVMVDYQYDDADRLEEVYRGNGATHQYWTYDDIGRMETTTIDEPASAFDVTWGFTRNAASQISSESQTNDSYSWDGFQAVGRNYTTNGLNQYVTVSGQTYCYDDNGNLTADGDYVYIYDVENRLVEMRAQPLGMVCASVAYTGQIKAELRYDPMGRLYEVENFVNGVGQGARSMLYDGDALVAEYNAQGGMLKRYIHGPLQGVDDPIAEYAGSSTAASNRTNLYTDARGSIVLRAEADGTGSDINTYDEYGQPSASNTGAHQYTGQVWLPELGMYYYKARIYSPALGRFMQTDPIGYEDNVNLYGYVGQDPINGVDPTGLQACDGVPGTCIEADGFDPAVAPAETVVADDSTTDAVRANREDFKIADQREYRRTNARTATINENGEIEPISNATTETDRSGGQVAGTIRQSDPVAAIHGHAIEDGTIAPGEFDDSVVNNGLPNFIVRGSTVGVVEKVNGQFRMRVWGRMQRAERGAGRQSDRSRIQGRLDTFQSRLQGTGQ